MVNTVNKIPSINLPLVNDQGIIHPIWYEFFRSFISSVGDTSGGGGDSNTVVAGAGIEGLGPVATVNVGQGEGIKVNTNDVAIDITGQVNALAAPEDEILIADASDGSRIRKTSLRDVSLLSVANPGGTNGQIQYNRSGEFAGDSTFTTDGAGTYTVTGNFALGNNVHFYWPGGSATTYGIGGEGGTPYLQGQSTAYKFLSTSSGWSMGVGSGSTVVWSAVTGAMTLTGLTLQMANNYISNYTVTGITASTTQTQGQGSLSGEINVISTVANVNDTVTLPLALAGRTCVVINNGANTLQIFPASGDDLGAGLNTSATLAANSNRTYRAYDSTNWKQMV